MRKIYAIIYEYEPTSKNLRPHIIFQDNDSKEKRYQVKESKPILIWGKGLELNKIKGQPIKEIKKDLSFKRLKPPEEEGGWLGWQLCINQEAVVRNWRRGSRMVIIISKIPGRDGF